MSPSYKARPPEGAAPALHRQLRVLSLSGGGYRGLFSARILELLEERIRRKGHESLHHYFDLIAGTSIGGLLACGIAAEVGASTLLATIKEHGPSIFPHQIAKTARKAAGTAYDQGPLRAAIEKALGKLNAQARLSKVKKPLLVPAVSWTTGSSRVFRSEGLAGVDASKVSMLDVCLATSAAPTYFPSHAIDGDQLIDGGLVANAPDLFAVVDALRYLGRPLNEISMISIGTASIGAGGMSGDIPTSGAGWMYDARIVSLTIAAQERAAVDACSQLLENRYVRIDQTTLGKRERLGDMDIVDASMTDTLLALADKAFEQTSSRLRL